MLLSHRSPTHKLLTSANILMGSKHFLLNSKAVPPVALSSGTHPFHTYRLIFSTFHTKPISPIFFSSARTCGFSYRPQASVPRPVFEVNPEEKRLDSLQISVLKQKLEDIGIGSGSCEPGQYYRLLCPKASSDGKTSVSIFEALSSNLAKES
ncbi:unnamed protein product [Ilex paraguariensis]|uniref:Uncharacterized protein n=1 Tax=Ilex paraguariensis TaxID=185542 RepID=A0ABC8QUF6_9AQUA